MSGRVLWEGDIDGIDYRLVEQEPGCIVAEERVSRRISDTGWLEEPSNCVAAHLALLLSKARMALDRIESLPAADVEMGEAQRIASVALEET